MSPSDAGDLEWPLSVGMQVSALPPIWIAMIISCWSVKLLKLPGVTLTHVCGTNSYNWWAKGLPGVGVVKIFCDSESSGWKSFRLRLHDSTALVLTMKLPQHCKCKSKHHFPYTIVPVSHEQKQLQKVKTNHLKANWFQPWIPPWHRDK